MLNILLMIILIIILLIFVLLYIGVKITLTYDKKGSELEGCLKILILKKIKVYSVSYPPEDEEKDEDSDEDKKDRDIKKIFELMKPCFKYFKEYMKSFMKCIHITKLQNHLIFGLDSYADTAEYIGYIWSILIFANSMHEKAQLSAEPSFNGSVLDGWGRNEIDINILKMMPPTIKLISKKEVRQLIKGVIDDQRN